MNIVITGASSGLGKAISDHINHSTDIWWIGVKVFNWSLDHDVDVRSKWSIDKATSLIEGPVDILINCAGINRINFLPDVGEDEWDEVMDTNARGIFLTTQCLLEKLRGGTVCNIVSNASHLPMTSSLVYNASKGAAEIMTRQMARELKKTHDITVFGISPNKLSGTAMSKHIDERVCSLRGWTPEQARAYQLAGLPAGFETEPSVLAEIICFLLAKKERHAFLNGCVLDMGGP